MSQYLSMDQLVAYASRAGFKGDALRKIVAIAWAEGGGRVDAIGDGGNSVSTLQINIPSHPDVDRERLLADPAYAFEIAFQISGGGKNFDAWTTWSHRTEAGAKANAQQYLDDVDRATQAVNAAGGAIDLAPTSKPTKGGGVTSPAGTDSVTYQASSATGSTPEEITPESSPAEIEAYIKKTYPTLAPFLANDEIRKVLLRPDIDNLDDVEIEAIIAKTNYWQTHGLASRQFDVLIANDKNEAVNLIDKTKRLLSDVFSRAGVAADDAKLGEVAKNAIRAGWINLQGGITDQGALSDFTAFALRLQHPDGDFTAGTTPAVDAQTLGSIAKTYGIQIPQKSIGEWALRIMDGTATEDTFRQYVTTLAKSQWSFEPDVIKAIDSGIAPTDFFAPHQQAIAQALELAPDQVDLFGDPQWSDVTQMYDPAIKGRRAMTVGEAAQLARNRPEYAGTTAYKDTKASTELQLAQALGMVA